MRTFVLCVASLSIVAGCDKLTGTKPDPAASASAGTTGAAPTGTTAVVGTVTATATGSAGGAATVGTVTAGGGTTPTGVTTTQVNNGAKQVGVQNGPNGSTLNLKNDAGTGQVTTTSGGVNITGKDGKTLSIPTGGIPGMPR